MSDKTDYVMLPPKRGSAPRKPLLLYTVFTLLLVVVAAVSWWVGQRGGVHNDNPNAEIKQVPPNPETPSDPQLASATPATTSNPAAANPAPKPDPGTLATGGITIRSVPDGASLNIANMDDSSNRLTQKTPATLTDLPSGFYDMTISMNGYKSYTGTFEVVANKVRELTPVELKQMIGRLDVMTNATATWQLHKAIGNAQFEVVAEGVAPGNSAALPTGNYQLSITRKGWPTVTRSVSVVENLTTEVKHEFPEGGIKITSAPEGVEVLLRTPNQEEPVPVGETPMNLDSLPIGNYEVVLKPKEGTEKQMLVKVEAGKVAEAYGSWSKIAVQLTSDPPGATVFKGSTRLYGEGEFATTPMKVMLMEGNHDLLAVKEGLTDVPLKFMVVGNRNNNANFQFQHGALRVSTQPSGAEVFLGNKSLGLTPLMIPHMKPQEYEFKIYKERYAVKKITERVLTGRQLDVNVALNYDPLPDEGENFTNGVRQRMVWVAELGGWAEATETSQYAFSTILNKNASEIKGDRLPVTNVTWNEAMKYCEQLTLHERGQGLMPVGYRYTLPTDAQWTLLAGEAEIGQAVTSLGGTREGPEEIGSLKPNELGIYDTRGNVWEWCFDWYSQEVFNREQRENASGKSINVGSRVKVLRGGSWNRSLKSQLEVGYRFVADPGKHQNWESGFRVILTKEPAAGR